MTELDMLLEKVRALPPMTEHQKREQGMDFAYGTLACTSNHKPRRRAFEAIALGRGWTPDEFAAWAGGREWWDE